MKTTTFYGIPINELSALELQLLSLDIQISAIRNLNAGDAIIKLTAIMKIRKTTIIGLETANATGDYSRKRFLIENGLNDNIGPTEDEIEIFSNGVDEMGKRLHSVLSGVLSTMTKKEAESESNTNPQLN